MSCRTQMSKFVASTLRCGVNTQRGWRAPQNLLSHFVDLRIDSKSQLTEQGNGARKLLNQTNWKLINYCFRKVLLHQLFNQQSDLFNINFALSILRVMSFVFVLSGSVRRLIWKDLFWHLPSIAINCTFGSNLFFSCKI